MELPSLMSPGRTLMSGMEMKDRLVEEIILLALFLVSTAANSLALLVFCRRPGLRTISNRFVINLLATNLVTTSLLAPALFGEHSARGERVAVWLEAGDCAAAACSSAGLLAVLLIALDQHHAVTDPLRCHARLLQRRPAALCAATWLAAAAAAAARAAIAVARYYYPHEPALQAVQLVYGIVYLILGILTPTTIVCVMYARIYRAARSSGLRARAQGASAMQLHEPPPLPDLVEEGEGLTLKIDAPDSAAPPDADRKFGPFLLPPTDKPRRYPSVASLRNAKKEGKSNEDLRKGLPSVSSAPSLAAPLLAARTPQPSATGSRITSIRCRISNASLFRYREESRAARVGLLTGALVALHVPHAVGVALAGCSPALAAAVRAPALGLLLLACAASPFLFALRSRRVQREARRLLLPEKSAWERAGAGAAAADGQRARAALELLRTLSPGAPPPGNADEGAACRGSFSSGGSTQLSSASDE